MAERKRATQELVSLNARVSERGFSLMETLLVVAIVVLAVGGTYTLSRSPAAVSASLLVLPKLFDEARELAATSGDGATLVLRPGNISAQTRSFEVVIYRGRPRANGIFDFANPTQTERLSGILQTSLNAGGPAAVFISTSGAVSYAAWSPSQGPIANEPPCTTPLILTVSGVTLFLLPCSDARLTRLSALDGSMLFLRVC